MIAIADLFTQFERRLDGSGPVGVAVSGGGDSVALLHMLARWGKRPLHVFCVDHGLQPQGGEWTDFTGRLAARLGAGFTPLAWQGDKPATGLSAAARKARHLLLAEAARARGIRVLCLGHTRDDVAEAEAMRARGSNVGSPRAWTPSPVWPQGRGVFLFRPLLSLRRGALRDWLGGQGEGWIDDPANVSPASLRATVRRVVAADLPPLPEAAPLLDADTARDLIDATWAGRGLIAFRRPVFERLNPDRALRLLALAVVCAGGGDHLPRSGEVERLLEAVTAGGTRTLCGARVEADAVSINMLRDAGDMRRRPLGGELWDGRFEATADALPSWAVRPRPDDVRALPEALRDSQPLQAAANAALRQNGYTLAEATCRVLPRFLAAAGVFTLESEPG